VILLAAAIVVLLILVNALYVAAEFSAVSSRRARVAELAEGGDRAAKALLPVLEDRALLDRYIAACQVGITLSSLLVGYYGQAAFTPRVAPLLANVGLSEAASRSITVTAVLLVLTFLQVILGELLPKSVALRFPERLARVVVYPMLWSLVLLRPLIAILNGSALLVLRRFGKSEVSEEHVHHPDELEGIFRESAEGGLLDADERDMLTNVFHLRQRVARQIMIPRTRIVAVSIDRRPDELVRELIPEPFTRFPAYRGTIDQVRGFIDIRDLWALASENPEADLSAIVRPMPIVPESLSVTDLWARLRLERTGMAAIFDEYGGIVGIVTVEDILEELFGELQDEFDRELELYRREEGGQVTLRGDLLVSEVNERFLLALPEEPADTIGGLVMDRLGRVPRVGDEVEVAGVRLRVIDVAGQAVARVRFGPESVRRGEDVRDE
jgi:putative hemolysin